MVSATSQQRIYLSAEPVDMRGGFDRLAGRVKQAGLDLYAGHLFVFLSKRGTHLKVLTWDGSGLVVLYKRLGRGKFVRPVGEDGLRADTLDAGSFAKLLAGAETVRTGRSLSPKRRQQPVDGGGRT